MKGGKKIMGLFTTKKPKKKAKVLEMEEDDEDEDDAEDDEDEENEEEVEIPENDEKAQLGAIKRHLSTPKKKAKAPNLTEEAIIEIFNEFDARLTRLEKHSILVGARD